MRAASLIVVATTVALILALFFYVDTAEAAPKRGGGGGGRRGGGGGRKSGGSSWFGGGSKKTGGTSWFGGGSKKTNTGYGGNKNYGNTGTGYGSYQKKKGIGSKLKKAAVIGAVAYGGYQLGKLSAGYGNYGWGRQHGYGFNQWNRDREADGMLCRNTNDCNWIDPRMYCQDYELDFSISRTWYGGDFASIVGECSCPHGYYFNDRGRNLGCESQGFFSGMSGTSLVLAILIPLAILICCCCGAVYAFRKMFS